MAGPAVATLLKLIRAKASRKAIEKAIKGLSKPRPRPKPPRPGSWAIGKINGRRKPRAKVPDKVPTEVRRKLAGTGKPKKKPLSDARSEARRFEVETNRMLFFYRREEKRRAALAAKRKIKGLGIPPLAK